MGDVFGTTVNLASRLTSIAPKDAVLVDGAFAEELMRTGDAPASEAEARGGRAGRREKEGREEPPVVPLRAAADVAAAGARAGRRGAVAAGPAGQAAPASGPAPGCPAGLRRSRPMA